MNINPCVIGKYVTIQKTVCSGGGSGVVRIIKSVDTCIIKYFFYSTHFVKGESLLYGESHYEMTYCRYM